MFFLLRIYLDRFSIFVTQKGVLMKNILMNLFRSTKTLETKPREVICSTAKVVASKFEDIPKAKEINAQASEAVANIVKAQITIMNKGGVGRINLNHNDMRLALIQGRVKGDLAGALQSLINPHSTTKITSIQALYDDSTAVTREAVDKFFEAIGAKGGFNAMGNKVIKIVTRSEKMPNSMTTSYYNQATGKMLCEKTMSKHSDITHSIRTVNKSKETIKFVDLSKEGAERIKKAEIDLTD